MAADKTVSSIVKEGGLETLLEVSAIVLIGVLISNGVCFLFWPQHATRNLHKTMSQTLDSFSTLLTMITETFLLEEPLLLVSQAKLDQAAKNHQASFTKLRKDLNETQSERIVNRTNKSALTLSSAELGLADTSHSPNNLNQAYDDAIDSLNRLGQHLNGLRSGIGVQHELVKASRDGKLHLRSRSTRRYRTNSVLSINGQSKVPDGGDDRDAEETALLQAAADAFGDMIEDLGPPLKALSVNICTDVFLCFAADARLFIYFCRVRVAIVSSDFGKSSMTPGLRRKSSANSTLKSSLISRSHWNVHCLRSRAHRTMPLSDCIAAVWDHPRLSADLNPFNRRAMITPCSWVQIARASSWFTCTFSSLLSSAQQHSISMLSPSRSCLQSSDDPRIASFSHYRSSRENLCLWSM